MPVNPVVLIDAKIAENVQTQQYRNTNYTTIIDKMTAINFSGGAATISLNLIKEGDSAGNQNLVTKAYSIAAGGVYLFPEVVGHILAPGDSISTIAGTANAIAIRSSGRQVS